ncbi:5' exonuclease Apollo [Morella rubra]|uniref:Protein artemis n=1 Tax=Morella rubra TaxID=262757 RepID=A0A6A1VC21_9ROSI|nr:5' exonuclease Apollo [Morella rubra]
MEKGLITVDRWTGYSQAYFVTHLHSDHTQNLSSTWAKGPIYCSRLTARLFPLKFGTSKCPCSASLTSARGIPSLLSLPPPPPERSPLSRSSPSTLTIVLVQLCSCFVESLTNKETKIARTMLLNALKDDVVDILYLDNTYCNPSYAFSSREIVAQQVVNIIASHPKHDIIIGIDTLGIEDLLLRISHALKTKIWLWPERLQTMHLLGFHDIFTTKTSLTRVRAVPRYSFSTETLEFLNAMRPTIGIMPSGLPWVVKPLERHDKPFGSLPWSGGSGSHTDKQNGDLQYVEKLNEYSYSVPYSDHSCFAELQDFIKLVQPTNIKATSRLCRANQPAQRLHWKHMRKEKGERAPTVWTRATFSKGASAESEWERGRTVKVRYSGIRVSRTSALRRLQRGAKIVENECTDCVVFLLIIKVVAPSKLCAALDRVV